MAKENLEKTRQKALNKLKNLNTLQLSDGKVSPDKKWKDWGLVIAESTYITGSYTELSGYMDIINTGRNCPPAIKDAFDLRLKEFKLYDHGPVDPHRIYEKIAIFGKLSDWETLEIRGHTTLAKQPTHSTGEGTQVFIPFPQMRLRSNAIGQQLFAVTNPATPTSRAKPPKVAFVRMYRYIGSEPPKSLDDFKPVGIASKGLFLSQTDVESPDPKTKYFSHHFAKYEFKDGTMSMPSQVVVTEVLYMVQV